MPKEIYLLKVGMTMTEGMVSQWYVEDGDPVTRGEMLYALETEKVNMDVDAGADGIVRHRVPAGSTLAPGEVVGFIFEADEPMPEDIGSIPVQKRELDPIEIDAAGPSTAAREPESSPAPRADAGRRVRSSPAARKLAQEMGVDLTGVKGTGPGGRIVKEDILAAPSSTVEPPAPVAQRVTASPIARRLAAERGIDLQLLQGSGPGGRIVEADLPMAGPLSPGLPGRPGTSIPLSTMRRTIGRRMHASLQESAQLTMDMEVPMDDAVKLRSQLIEEWQHEGIRPTYTDLVIRAVARALGKHPLMNSILGEDAIETAFGIHIGVAVSLDEGLVVPVIRDADQLSIKEIAVQSARLAAAARAGRLSMDDYANGTFTISSLGMFGVDAFTPILNSPQAGILGVNRIVEGLAWDDDRPVKAMKMNLSLTWDHRVLDGAPAAQFLGEVRDLLAAPYRLLV
ncbi:MAG: 2-oxo acid dehydrogenase subunit E2 [Proteobacteria bacterium]|jgi:pyruvate/2-oxoglutarate dehydrogenase complex dihydrolipoamide acyltransferase (E2) component|nr:2-oxo acid dehydrogenase subunit E2 [Pseudomonadota bacterium]MDA1298834.1 2-oxo acid dehydrogenase subunit E2 [Pseudomonadota bacterium]